MCLSHSVQRLLSLRQPTCSLSLPEARINFVSLALNRVNTPVCESTMAAVRNVGRHMGLPLQFTGVHFQCIASALFDGRNDLSF